MDGARIDAAVRQVDCEEMFERRCVPEAVYA